VLLFGLDLFGRLAPPVDADVGVGELTGMSSRVAEHELQYRVLPTQAFQSARKVEDVFPRLVDRDFAIV
jgi:hypothetical protein